MLGSFIALNTVLHVTPLMSDVCYHTRSEWRNCWLHVVILWIPAKLFRHYSHAHHHELDYSKSSKWSYIQTQLIGTHDKPPMATVSEIAPMLPLPMLLH